MKYVGFFLSTICELSLSLTTVKGPAPTGVSRNLRSPIFLFAVGEGTQLALESMNDAAAGA